MTEEEMASYLRDMGPLQDLSDRQLTEIILGAQNSSNAEAVASPLTPLPTYTSLAGGMHNQSASTLPMVIVRNSPSLPMYVTESTPSSPSSSLSNLPVNHLGVVSTPTTTTTGVKRGAASFIANEPKRYKPTCREFLTCIIVG